MTSTDATRIFRGGRKNRNSDGSSLDRSNDIRFDKRSSYFARRLHFIIMMLVKTFLLSFLLCVSATCGFIFGEPMIRHPQLTEFLQVQQNFQVGLHLDIGKEGADARLAVQNFQLAFEMQDTDEGVPMPGTHGMHPNLSGGLKSLQILQPGSFVTAAGMQHIQPSKACWELVWKKDAHAGSLLVGLELPQDYQRNEIKLPQGIVYLNFPVWSQEGLAVAKAAQVRALQRAKECLEERNIELEKLKATDNPLMKVWHYRNAYAAIETYGLQPLKHYKEIVPSSEEEVLELPGQLYLTTKGFCWTKELPRGPQYLLGTAKLTKK